MSNFFYRLISSPTSQAASPLMSDPRRPVALIEETPPLDAKQAGATLGLAALVLFGFANLSMEGGEVQSVGVGAMQFSDKEAANLVVQIERCTKPSPGNSQISELNSYCTRPRTGDADGGSL